MATVAVIVFVAAPGVIALDSVHRTKAALVAASPMVIVAMARRPTDA